MDELLPTTGAKMSNTLAFGQRVKWPLEDRVKALGESEWSAEFDHDQLDRLASAVVVRELGQGDTLFREGDPGYFVAILAQGMAKVLKEGDDDMDHLIAEVGAGSCLGEMALVDHRPRSASVIASRTSVMLILTVEAFQALGKKEPRIWGLLNQRFARSLSERLRKTSEDMVEIITNTGFDSERY